MSTLKQEWCVREQKKACLEKNVSKMGKQEILYQIRYTDADLES